MNEPTRYDWAVDDAEDAIRQFEQLVNTAEEVHAGLRNLWLDHPSWVTPDDVAALEAAERTLTRAIASLKSVDMREANAHPDDGFADD